MVNIALIDDHSLLRNGLAVLITKLGYSVMLEADNGKEFIKKLKPKNLPDLVMLDINMPVMDGYETAGWIKKNYPSLKVLVLSMYDDEMAIIKMIRLGAKGYILKDTEPDELKNAVDTIINTGFYYSDLVNDKLVNAVINNTAKKIPKKNIPAFTKNEMVFIKYACTEISYKAMAEKMELSPRTIDGYREDLFEKLQVKSRVGLILYAIKNKIVNI